MARMPEPEELSETQPVANPSQIPTPAFHFASGSNFTHAFVGNNNITNTHYHFQCQHRHSHPDDEKLTETQRPAVRQSSSRTRMHSEPGHPDSHLPLDLPPTLGRSAAASHTPSVGSLPSSPVGIAPLPLSQNSLLRSMTPIDIRSETPPPRLVIKLPGVPGSREGAISPAIRTNGYRPNSEELPASHSRRFGPPGGNVIPEAPGLPGFPVAPGGHGLPVAPNPLPSSQRPPVYGYTMASPNVPVPLSDETIAWRRIFATMTPDQIADVLAPQVVDIIQGRGNTLNRPEGWPALPDIYGCNSTL